MYCNYFYNTLILSLIWSLVFLKTFNLLCLEPLVLAGSEISQWICFLTKLFKFGHLSFASPHNVITISKDSISLSEIDFDTERPLYFSIQSLEFPLTLRWRNATTNSFAFWRIYGGVSLQWNFKNKAKQNSNIFSISDELKKWGATTHLSFGYNTWNFYFAYRLNPIFDSSPENNQDLSVQLTPIKFGLIFYIL